MPLKSTMNFFPLEGLKILDLSQGVAGPYCTQLLLEQGAEVIKVEPAQGDWGRHVGVASNGHSTISSTYNRGKKSLAIDAKHPQGRDLLLRLAKQADVIVQNFRPQVVKRLGLDFESLCALGLNPVYVSISGYGDDGPFADRPATDSVMQADSGLMHTNRNAMGDPQRVGFLLADIATGLYAAQACTAALLQRMRTAKGHHVELNLFEVCCALQSTAMSEELWRQENGSPAFSQAVSAPNGIFEAADGKITILALNNEQFKRICDALDRPGWMDDPRFSTNELRLQNKDSLHQMIGGIVKRYTLDAVEVILQKHSVLHARVRTAKQVAQHPQAQHLGTFQTFDQPGFGAVQVVASVFGSRSSAMPVAPRIGQHSAEILHALGLSDAEIQKLTDSGVIVSEDGKTS